MGHWGTAILSNDTAADIRDAFFNLYDKGQPLDTIRKKIETDFREGDKLSENTDLWLTLALLQWQIGSLDTDVKEFAEKIIDDGIDLKVWKECEADEKTLTKRKAELLKLKEKLQTINSKPRKIKKKVIQHSILKKGEIYAFQLNDGNYTAIIILEEIINEDYYFVVIANTDITMKELPTIDDVLKANILLLPAREVDKLDIRPAILSYTNIKHKNIVKRFIKIGSVIVTVDYSGKFLSIGLALLDYMFDFVNTYLGDNKLVVSKNILVKNYVKSTDNWFKKLFKK
jgi:hypothetical protein